MLNPIINHSYLLIWARRQSLSGRRLKPVDTHGRPLLSAEGNGTQQHLLTLRLQLAYDHTVSRIQIFPQSLHL